MDPALALLQAFHALAQGQHTQAREHLSAYEHWRAMGGFEPDLSAHEVDMPGDQFADVIKRGLH